MISKEDLESLDEFKEADYVIGCEGSNSVVAEKIYGQREESDIMCISGIVEDYHFDEFFTNKGYKDYPYETLGACSLTGKPARFADIPLPDRDSKR